MQIRVPAGAHDLEGCSFVEGHKVLSPTTRDRIERNDIAKAIRLRTNMGRNSSIDGGTGTAGAPDTVIGIIRPDATAMTETDDDDGDSDNDRVGNSN